MKIENIIKNLEKQGINVYHNTFLGGEYWFANGTCLADIINDCVQDTNAKLSDVELQIKNGKSHIYTQNGKNKQLTTNSKM